MNENKLLILGPGIWYTIHILAFNAKTDKEKEAFIITINTLCNNFICESCKPHFKKFIESNDLKKYWHKKVDNNDNIGFFMWTVELHNSVNKSLNKPIISL